jgi:hypothetical protein
VTPGQAAVEPAPLPPQPELTPLPAPPMPSQPLRVAPPILPTAKLMMPAALLSASDAALLSASDAPSYESDESDGLSYSSESDHDDVIDPDASTAARLSSPLNEAFRAVDPTLVWADWSSADAYVRDAEARRSKVLYLVPGSNPKRRYLGCASGLADGVIKPRPRGPRSASGAESRPVHQADASASEVTPAAPPILLAAPAPIADKSDPFGGRFSTIAMRGAARSSRPAPTRPVRRSC